MILQRIGMVSIVFLLIASALSGCSMGYTVENPAERDWWDEEIQYWNSHEHDVDPEDLDGEQTDYIMNAQDFDISALSYTGSSDEENPEAIDHEEIFYVFHTQGEIMLYWSNGQVPFPPPGLSKIYVQVLTSLYRKIDDAWVQIDKDEYNREMTEPGYYFDQFWLHVFDYQAGGYPAGWLYMLVIYITGGWWDTAQHTLETHTVESYFITI